MSESIGQNGQGEQNACCSRVAAHLSHAHLIFEVEERSLVLIWLFSSQHPAGVPTIPLGGGFLFSFNVTHNVLTSENRTALVRRDLRISSSPTVRLLETDIVEASVV